MNKDNVNEMMRHLDDYDVLSTFFDSIPCYS